MIMNCHCLAIGILVLGSAAEAQNGENNILPSAETFGALHALHPDGGPNRDASITSEDLLPLHAGREGGTIESGQVAPGVSVPFVVPDSLIVQVSPNLTSEDLDGLIEEYGWTVTQTFPALGQMEVSADLSEFFEPTLDQLDPNVALITGVVAASTAFTSDPRIVSATPDFVMRAQQSPAVGSYPRVDQWMTATTEAGEQVDWGIADIGAEALWALDGAQDGAMLGVLDVGFHRHEDLTYVGFGALPTDDHGNHVAGIACARHNGIGVTGIVPNCFVLPRAGAVFPVVDEGGDVIQFFVLFSQVIATMEQFLSEERDTRVFNLSLGYNWVANFGANPDEPANAIYRQLVAVQGESLMPTLQLAAASDVIIVSAAGNDSRSLPVAMRALYASPFNWAAFTAAERGLSRSGVVVEAHDNEGVTADFSNLGGHLSCPGVDVMSTISFDATGQPSSSEYGTMSGTSMASPYCAGGLLLFSLVRPTLSSEQIIDCVIASAEPSAGHAPRMRLEAALEQCP